TRAKADRGFTSENAGASPAARNAPLLAECSDGVDQLQCRTHRSLCVVLLDGGHAPHRHHSVADELLNRAAVAGDDRPRRIEIPAQQVSHVLGVALLRERGESDQVSEEHGDVPALRQTLLLSRQRISRQSVSADRHRSEASAALTTEIVPDGVGGAARGTCPREGAPALDAEACAGAIVGAARRAGHTAGLACSAITGLAAALSTRSIQGAARRASKVVRASVSCSVASALRPRAASHSPNSRRVTA